MADAKVDVVYGMTVPQRIDHLVCGYIRINYYKSSNRKESNLLYVPSDIASLCSTYTGISQHNHYDLIISNTELAIEAERKRKMSEDKKKIAEIAEAYSSYAKQYDKHDIKLVVLGAGGVGKSALTIRFLHGTFTEEYDPTIEDHTYSRYDIDGMIFNFDILDVAGQEQFAALTEQWMRESDCYIFVYSIDSMNSFQEMKYLVKKSQLLCEDQWETTKYGIIAGNKCDLEEERQVLKKEGQEFVDQFTNFTFYETSAKCEINVKEIFYECGRMKMYYYLLNCTDYYKKQKKKKKSCVLL